MEPRLTSNSLRSQGYPWISDPPASISKLRDCRYLPSYLSVIYYSPCCCLLPHVCLPTFVRRDFVNPISIATCDLSLPLVLSWWYSPVFSCLALVNLQPAPSLPSASCIRLPMLQQETSKSTFMIAFCMQNLPDRLMVGERLQAASDGQKAFHVSADFSVLWNVLGTFKAPSGHNSVLLSYLCISFWNFDQSLTPDRWGYIKLLWC